MKLRIFLALCFLVALTAAHTVNAQTTSPCSQPGIYSQSQDPTSKVWSCTYKTLGDQTRGAGFITEYYNADGSPVLENGVPKTLHRDTFSGTATSQSGEKVPTSTGKCTSWFYDFSFEGCIWNPLLIYSGTAGLMLGAFVLRGIGYLFDSLIETVIINFGGLLTSLKIADAIAVGWTIFRDFSNILIIGMFTFISICIILGIKEYGQKKLIANVLIVAVLLNFSLLFTRLVIDASNFVAYQIYSAVAVKNDGMTENFGVAEGFLRAMGITSIWNDSYAVVKKIADTPNTGGSFQAWAFGWVGGIMLLTVSLVLAYGAFLIAARGILLIFLMITAALAFATYLIPGMAQGEYGFNKWWKTLLNAAIFAPLLMIFLAVSLVIIRTAQEGRIALVGKDGNVPLGTIVADPQTLTNSGAWTTILVFIIGTGLLFLSIRLSSKFAGSISGFNLAGAASLLPLGLASRFLAAPLARQTIGRRAFRLEHDFEHSAQGSALNASRARSAADRLIAAGDAAGARAEIRAANRFERLAAKQASKALSYEATAHSKLNPMDNKAVQSALAAAGIKGLASGKSGEGTQSYSEQVAARQKEADKIAEKLNISDKDRADAVQREKERIADERQAGLQQLQAVKEANAATVAEIKNLGQQQRAAAETQLSTVQADSAEQKELIVKERDSVIGDLARQISERQRAGQDARDLEDLRRSRIDEYRTKLRNQDLRVTEAQNNIDVINNTEFTVQGANGQSITMSYSAAQQAEAGSQAAITQYNAETTSAQGRAELELLKSVTESSASAIRQGTRYQQNIIDRAISDATGVNNAAAEAAIKKARASKSANSQLKKLLKDAGIAQDTPPAAATPPTPPAADH